MALLLINILLAFIWCALTGQFIFVQFVIGYLLGFAIISLTTWHQNGKIYLRKTYLSIAFFTYIIWELVVSTLRVAYAVLSPLTHCNPGVVAIPLECRTPIEITLLANLISLTPGTLTLDISSDNKIIYVHGMFMHNTKKFRDDIKHKLEKPILEILR